MALGAVAASAGLDAYSAAIAAVYEAVTGPATAAVRLLGLDPFAVHAVLARIGPALDAIAAKGATFAHTPPEDLPAWSAPLLDILAEHHTTWEVRLFAS
jgi:urease accessory protein